MMTLVQQRLATLATLLLVASAAGGLVVWQTRHSASESERRNSAGKLFSFDDTEAVTRALLICPNGTFELARQGQGDQAWQLTRPMATLAEASTVESLLQAALDLKLTGRVGGQGPKDDLQAPVDAPSDLGLYGLANPRMSLTLTAADGKSETLLVGKKNAYDGSIYVKRADRSDVGLVESGIEYQLDRDLYKLREKRPFIASVDDLEKITVRGAYSLERQERTWRLRQPIDALADETHAAALAGALTGLRAKLFASENAISVETLRAFGLQAPRFTVDVRVKNQGELTLLMGEIKLGDESRFFVKRADAPVVMELGSDWAFKKLGIAVSDLRDNHVLHFAREAVQSITISRGQAQIVLRRQTGDKGGAESWQFADGEGTAAYTKVSGLLFKLADLRAERIAVDKPTPAQLTAAGLDAPTLRIELTGANSASLATLRAGKSDNQGTQVTDAFGSRIDWCETANLEAISITHSDYQDATAQKSN